LPLYRWRSSLLQASLKRAFGLREYTCPLRALIQREADELADLIFAAFLTAVALAKAGCGRTLSIVSPARRSVSAKVGAFRLPRRSLPVRRSFSGGGGEGGCVSWGKRLSMARQARVTRIARKARNAGTKDRRTIAAPSRNTAPRSSSAGLKRAFGLREYTCPRRVFVHNSQLTRPRP